jgi:hypothetical protein
VTEYAVPLEEAQVVLALLATARAPRGSTALRTLAELLDHRGLEQAAEVLIRASR